MAAARPNRDRAARREFPERSASGVFIRLFQPAFFVRQLEFDLAQHKSNGEPVRNQMVQSGLRQHHHEGLFPETAEGVAQVGHLRGTHPDVRPPEKTRYEGTPLAVELPFALVIALIAVLGLDGGDGVVTGGVMGGHLLSVPTVGRLL